MIKANLKKMKMFFHFEVPDDFPYNDEIDELVTPLKFAPVFINDGIKNVVKLMRFSLLPSWSKESKVSFATHNARIETVSEKPTWKNPFRRNHAIVPMTHFIEPIYENKLAGNMVQFHEKHNEILAAAAIYDRWTDKKTGQVIESFAIITDEPKEFVARTGHDREPVFLKKEAFAHWLDPKSNDPLELVHFLKNNSANPDLDVAINRPLKPGWEKRIPKD